MRRQYIVVTPFFPEPDNFRGPFVYDQVRAIMKTREYEVVVFKPTIRSDKREFYEYEGIKVYLFPALQCPSYIFNGFFNNINAGNFVRAVNREGIRIDGIVAVHCHTSSFGAYGLALKKINPNIKVLLQHHDKDPFTIMNGKFASWRTNARYRAKKNIDIFNKVDVHVAISRACEANLRAFPHASIHEKYAPYVSKMPLFNGLKKITPQKVSILYNGVDIDKFYQKTVKRESIFTIGCIGNFISLKGQQDLIRAVYDWSKNESEQNYKLIFIGSGPQKRDCENLVSELNMDNNVEFETEVQHDKLIDFYNTFDLFILPSHFDGFGCVCLEASACGVPFMISRNQGACEYFTDDEEAIWAFDAGDHKQLSNNIKYFYANRPTQHLKYPIDINELVSRFLREIGL